jgi:hypothetical protein
MRWKWAAKGNEKLLVKSAGIYTETEERQILRRPQRLFPVREVRGVIIERENALSETSVVKTTLAIVQRANVPL